MLNSHKTYSVFTISLIFYKNILQKKGYNIMIIPENYTLADDIEKELLVIKPPFANIQFISEEDFIYEGIEKVLNVIMS
ncbi:hypothetical protein Neuguinea42_03900 [Helicobacter pylori]|nr:hypothetical protein AA974_05280 [Helicobacter pylori]